MQCDVYEGICTISTKRCFHFFFGYELTEKALLLLGYHFFIYFFTIEPSQHLVWHKSD